MRQEYMPRYKVQRKVKKRNLQSFFVKKRLYLPLLPFRGVFSTGFSSFSAFYGERFQRFMSVIISEGAGADTRFPVIRR